MTVWREAGELVVCAQHDIGWWPSQVSQGSILSPLSVPVSFWPWRMLRCAPNTPFCLYCSPAVANPAVVHPSGNSCGALHTVRNPVRTLQGGGLGSRAATGVIEQGNASTRMVVHWTGRVAVE